MTRFPAALAAFALATAPACAIAQTAAAPAEPAPAVAPAPIPSIAPAGDLADTLRASGQFTILVKALDATNLTGVLKSAGPLTLLAPTDAAFNALPAGQLETLMKPDNAAALQQLLIYHLINAGVAPAKIQGSIGPIRTVAGTDVHINGTGATVQINDATVVGEGAVSNGFVYAVDKVLDPAYVPPAAPAAPAPAAQP